MKVVTTEELAHESIAGEGWLLAEPEPFRRALLQRAVLQRYPSGGWIYGIGDEPGGFYGVVAGTLRINISAGEDGPQFVHLLKRGNWIGEGPAMTGMPRLVGVSASPGAVVLHVPLPALTAILDGMPSAWQSIARNTRVKLEMMLTVISDLAIRNDEKRLIATLLRLGDVRYASKGGPAQVEASQFEIGVMANLARTTVSVMLKRLEAAGLIAQNYRHVVLIEPDRLRRLLETNAAE